ncbi:5-aminolevulinate synthase-like [Sycon ciliatum]|uniref:5-aminolevulinate synthase-like n=1 Tax=Sycon ciliatum TaxID=27933 RepID=UPI0020A84B89|eukprot:scpid37760/ scgid20387/ 5-aminolevulinate synthase, erythroid-specific, mitochondrial; 5-aminolevulinic acid synthase 2; Delta-ALA synthase 2; Delta-aminolevulinate synthase 2
MACAPTCRRSVRSILDSARLLGGLRHAPSTSAAAGMELKSKAVERPQPAFDYDTFFRKETEFRLAQGMYDFFLPLHQRVNASLPNQAGAAPDLYEQTADIIPKLDELLDSVTAEPGDMSRRLEQVTEDLRNVTVFATTDYLGLSAHPLLIETMRRFTEKHGVSCTGSRYITGNTLYLQMLERECARMHRQESSILFLSCFDANNCILSCLGSWLPGCIIYSDEGNHASIIEGIQRSGGQKRIYRHCDTQHLEELLAADREEEDADAPRPKVIVFESVYSMLGDISPVPEIVRLARQYGALTFIDEAHSLGLFGENGRGILELQECEGEVDIVASTLGKGAGFQGGYVASSLGFTEAVRHRARGFVFTSALTPGMAATGLVALRILQTAEGRELREKLFHNVATVRKLLEEEGIPLIRNDSHIVPVCVHHPETVHILSRSLLHEFGVYVPAVRHPAVARGKELLRVVPMPGHTAAQINHLVEALAMLWKRHDLPLTHTLHRDIIE